MALKNKRKLTGLNKLYAWLAIDTECLKENKYGNQFSLGKHL